MKKRAGESRSRSDKKIDVKPTLSINLKDNLYTFAYLCDEPVKDVAEKLCIVGATSKVIIDSMSKWFRRNYVYRNVFVVGHPEQPKLKVNYPKETGKVTIRFKREDYDLISDLSHALDITPTATAGILIKMTLNSMEFIQQYAQEHLMHLSPERKKRIDLFLNQLWKTNHEGKVL
ncbi:hypothetical protein D1B33_07370 [Lysinibacillus yapensis]|uniref:Uncharacterized protein n=1 Tax=Ureibacillus yapensis TaxID=2304605 RepID=A0A396SF78_9BACL|nr:hypothetical protein [Lysinibacillus yapensis]RHW38686.1 hypothetical protein D1B33_07370 [Lysinibacillus yapensis]